MFNFRKSFVLSGLRISAVVCLFVITMVAAFNLSGCGGSSASPSVTVTATLATADGSGGASGSGAAQTSTLTATVTNDKSTNGAPDGVTWTVSGAPSTSLSNTSTTGATFTAPAATSTAQTVTITATSVADTSKTGTVTITVPALIASTTTTAQLTGVVGTVYSQQLTVSGGNGTNTWSTTLGGTPPPGWTISASGVLSAPTAPTAGQAGTYPFTVAVHDSGTYSTTLSLTVTINAAPTITFPASATLTAGTYNVVYAGANVAATGGAGGLTYAVTSGSLPHGLGLNASSGAITGTPTTAASVGTFPFKVTATDGFGDTMVSPQYTIVVSYPAMNISTSTLPTGYIGSTYTQTTLAATGGTGVATNYTWAVTGSNALPAGLQLSTGGVLSGTPTGSPSGPTSISFKVTDTVANISATVSLSITVNAGVSITPAAGALPQAYANSLYTSPTLTASGGSGTGYTWSVNSGSSLPSWLSYSATSGSTTTLTGTPTATASAANFSLKVTDSAGNSATIAYNVTVGAGISISPATGTTLAAAYTSLPYTSVPLTASGGNGTYTWSVVSGSAPPAWLSLSATSGSSTTLTGTPTVAASPASFSLKVTDTAGNSATVNYSITVSAGIGINPAAGALPTAYVGAAYTSPTLTAAGGNGNYTWSVNSGSSLPAWLSFSSTTGASTTLTGTPSVVASSTSFTLKVADTSGNIQMVTYSITVNAGISISPVSGTTLPGAYAGSLYNSGTITVTGGNAAGGYSWGLTNSPLWLGLSPTPGATGSLIGTPSAAAGPATFSLRVADNAGNSQTVTYNVTVGAGISITPPTIPVFYPGAGYGVLTFSAAGGAGGPYNWHWAAASGSSLPSGLSLNTNGSIQGTPVNATSSSVTSNLVVTAQDSGGNTITTNVSITIEATLTVTTSGTLTPAIKGNPYSLQLHATGGTGGTVATGGTGATTPYSWSLSAADANNLSTTLGLTLNSSGVLSGTPSAAGGPVTFTPTVSDGTNTATPSAPLSISATAFSLTIVTPPPAFAVQGNSYSSGTFTATGGTGPYTWSISSGTMPIGLSLGSGTTATNSISGTVSSSATTGLYAITVSVLDTSTHLSATYTYPSGLNVYAPLVMTPNPNPLPTVIVNQYYPGATISCSGGSGGGNCAWLTSQPVGSFMTFTNNGSSLSISGKAPSTPQTISFTVTLTDTVTGLSVGPTQYSITVTPAVPTGYTVSGTVNYTGSHAGWVYLELIPNSGCSGCNQNLGTAIDGRSGGPFASPIAYTIHGVPAGTYTLNAYMDNIGNGIKNASNPTGSLSNLNVTSAGLSNQNFTLQDPSAVSLGTLTPSWDPGSGLGVFSGGAVVSFDPICSGSGCNNGGVEMPTSYYLQYSRDSSFSGTPARYCFQANGGNSPWIVTGLINGLTYYFRAAGYAGVCTNTPGALTYSAAEPSSGLLINAPSVGSSLSGTVTFTPPSGVTLAGGPLYVGCYASGTIYADPITSPVSPQAYSVTVPNGTNCQVFGFLDQFSSGLIGGPGELSNTSNGVGMIGVTVNGATPNQNFTLPSSNSIVEVKTQTSTGSGGANYGVGFQVYGEYKQPVAVELLSETPHVNGTIADVVLPADIATGAFNNYNNVFDYWPQVTGTPVVGDSYTFKVTYADGTSENLTAAVSGVLNAFATSLSPTGSGVSVTPNFSWGYPSSASSYVYQFQLQDTSNDTIWEIPPQHGSSNGFASTISPFITWGVDPTNSGDLPNSSYLSSGALHNSTNYNWSISAYDANMNEASVSASFTTATASLALPASGPGPALAGYAFTGQISASGGSGSGVFTVNGTLIPSTGIGNAVTINNGDGLSAYSTGSNTLYIAGTPTTAGNVSLTVSVIDSFSDTANQTYTLVVSSGPGTTGAHNSLLNGTYVCKFGGFFDSDGSRWSSLSSLVANGSGGITSGVYDMTNRDFAGAYGGTISSTSTYSVGADNMGVMTINAVQTVGVTGTNTNKFAIALNDANGATSTATEFRMVEIDDVGTSPSGQHGAGVCYQATTSAFVPGTISGNSFVYGVQGEDGSGFPEAWVGRFTAGTESSNGGTGGAAGGSISNGVTDGMDLSNTGNGGNHGYAYTGTYTAPNATTGRFTIAIAVTGTSKTGTEAVYIIDANRAFYLMTVGDGGEQSGDMRLQQQGSTAAANTAATLLSSSSVLYSQAFLANSSGSVTGYDSMLAQVSGAPTSTYTDTLTVNASFDDSEGAYTAGSENGQTVAVTLDSANPGRATFAPGGGSDLGFFYFYNTGSAFYLELNGTSHYLETGRLEAQTQPSSPPFANASIAGSYLGGSLPRLYSGSNDSISEGTEDSSGGMTGSNTTANAGSLQWDQPFSAMGALGYSWLSTTYGAFSNSMNGTAFQSCIVITPVKSGAIGKAVCMENTSGGANVSISEQ